MGKDAWQIHLSFAAVISKTSAGMARYCLALRSLSWRQAAGGLRSH